MTREQHCVTAIVKDREYEFAVPDGGNLLTAALRHKAPLDHICRVGVCGACQVIVHGSGEAASPATDEEMQLLDVRPLQEGVRLACQVRVYDDMVVRQ